MGGCRCSYRNCKSATKVSGELHFFHYPVKHRERCNQWIKNARRPEFFSLPDDQLRNKVVCDLHFERKYFTNVLRKRLVHNAVPTINTGCDEEILNENSTEFKEVQILPANDDGTIFTVDTDSMQKSTDEPISTYSFRNGALVPVYNEEQPDTEPVLYTIEEDDIKPVSYQPTNQNSNYLFIDSNRQEPVPETYEIVFNGSLENNQVSYERKNQHTHSPIIGEYPRKSYTEPQAKAQTQDAMEVVYITEHEERTQSPPVIVKTEIDAVNVEPVRSKNLKSNLNVKVKSKQILMPQRPQPIKRDFINQINIHSREIASIKRTLNASLRNTQKFNLNKLRGRISPTLLGALSLNLYNRKRYFTREEIEFLTTVYEISPDIYNMFIEKLRWNLPEPSVVEELLKK